MQVNQGDKTDVLLAIVVYAVDTRFLIIFIWFIFLCSCWLQDTCNKTSSAPSSFGDLNPHEIKWKKRKPKITCKKKNIIPSTCSRHVRTYAASRSCKRTQAAGPKHVDLFQLPTGAMRHGRTSSSRQQTPVSWELQRHKADVVTRSCSLSDGRTLTLAALHLIQRAINCVVPSVRRTDGCHWLWQPSPPSDPTAAGPRGKLSYLCLTLPPGSSTVGCEQL